MATVVIMSYRGKNVVWPPYVVVKPGEDIIFKTVGTSAKVFLAKPEAFNSVKATGLDAGTVGQTITVGTHGVRIRVKGEPSFASAAAAVEGSLNLPYGVYPYAAYCGTPNDFAEGNSSPVILIEPPDPDPGLPWPGTDSLET
jgi:hypothetical protein